MVTAKLGCTHKGVDDKPYFLIFSMIPDQTNVFC